MHQLLKRLELIKTSIAIEDSEIIELQVMKIEKMSIDSDVKKILLLLKNNDFSNALMEIENYITRFSGVVVYEDKELAGLRLELKKLESKLQELSGTRNEYLNNIKEFNREYHLHLGSLIQNILKLKEEILYASIKVKKDAFESMKNRYEDEKKEYEDLESEISDKEEELKNTDEFDDEYDKIYDEVQNLKEELKQKEEEVNEKRKEAKKAKEELEEDEVAQEYEDVKQDSEEFNREYEEIKKEDVAKLDADEKKELKKLYRKASKLCHPDIVVDELKKQAHKLMLELNDAYSRQDINQVKEILYSLESGNGFDISSDKIDDKELLKSKIVTIRESIDATVQEITDIEEEDSFKIIQKYDDLELFFNEQSSLLKNEYENLKNNLESFKPKSTQDADDYDYWSEEF